MPEPLHLAALAVSLIAIAVVIRCAIATRRYRIRAEADVACAQQALAEIKEIHRDRHHRPARAPRPVDPSAAGGRPVTRRPQRCRPVWRGCGVRAICALLASLFAYLVLGPIVGPVRLEIRAPAAHGRP